MNFFRTVDSLIRRAEIVRDETNDSANTASRIGQLFIDVISNFQNVDLSSYLRKDKKDKATEIITFEKGIQIGDVLVFPDPEKKAIKISHADGSDAGIISTGFLSAYGSDPAAGGGEGGFTPIEVIDDLKSSSTTAALSANMGRYLKELVDMKVSDVTWTDITGKPTFANVATSGNYDDLANKPDLTTYLRKDKEDKAAELITFEKGIQIGNVLVMPDPEKNAIKISNADGSNAGFISTGFISAYGTDPAAGGGEGGVMPIEVIDDLKSTSTTAALSANMGRYLKELVDMKVSTVSWTDVTGKPTFANVATSGNYNDLTGKPTSLPANGGHAASASYLLTNYLGGVRINPQDYFNNQLGLKVAMTGTTNAIEKGFWSDTLWINGYNGSDVPNCCALHFSKGYPKMFLSFQRTDSEVYGQLHEVWTEENSGTTSHDWMAKRLLVSAGQTVASDEPTEFGISYMSSGIIPPGGGSRYSHLGMMQCGWSDLAKSANADLYFRQYRWDGWSSWNKVWTNKNSNLNDVPWNASTFYVSKGSIVSYYGAYGSRSYIWNESDTSLCFGTSNTERLTILPDGRIGVNNTNPYFAFDVNGILRATSQIITPSIQFVDTRSANPAPFDPSISRGITPPHLKGSGTIGLNDPSGSFAGVIYVSQWGDSSGGRMHRLAFTDNDNLWISGGSTAWDSWYNFWHSGNSNSPYVDWNCNNLRASGYINAYQSNTASDIRLKILKGRETGILDKIKDLNVYNYAFKHDPKNLHTGVIAQQVAKKFPNIAKKTFKKGNKKYYSVDYGALGTTVAIEGLKELHEIVINQQKQIDELKNLLYDYSKQCTH